jgi:hypothetical protein
MDNVNCRNYSASTEMRNIMYDEMDRIGRKYFKYFLEVSG